jgi:hypothetical protein
MRGPQRSLLFVGPCGCHNHNAGDAIALAHLNGGIAHERRGDARAAAKDYRQAHCGQDAASPKGSDPHCLLRYDTSVVEFSSTGRIAFDQDFRVGPDGNVRAVAAAFLDAHYVPPLGPVDVAEFVAGADQMPDLVREL